MFSDPAELKAWLEIGITSAAFLAFVVLVFRVGMPLVTAVEHMTTEFKLLRQALGGDQISSLVGEMHKTRESLEGMNKTLKKLEGALERRGLKFRIEQEDE